RLSRVMKHRLSAAPQVAELLQMLFPDGIDQAPRVRQPEHQWYVQNEIALSLPFSGQPGRAVAYHERGSAIAIDEKKAPVPIVRLPTAIYTELFGRLASCTPPRRVLSVR